VVPGGQLDRDLLVCPACRDLLRLEMASWLMHLVGLGTLPPFAGPVREVPLPTQPHRVEAW
jgi:hypothetical protein